MLRAATTHSMALRPVLDIRNRKLLDILKHDSENIPVRSFGQRYQHGFVAKKIKTKTKGK